MGEPVRFTAWGIVSGLFWVPGGVAGIYAIRNAGIAMAVGTWSSIIVLTSFFWGIIIFEERVQSIAGACGAVLTLITGLLGMSFFSRAPSTKNEPLDENLAVVQDIDAGDAETGNEERIRKRQSKTKIEFTTAPQKTDDELEAADDDRVRKRPKITKPGISATPEKKSLKRKKSQISINGSLDVIPSAPKSLPLTALEMESLIKSIPDCVITNEEKIDLEDKKNIVTLFDGSIALTRRQAGLIAAAFNGLWGGTNLIPLHFASEAGYGGPSYVVSFACGSLMVTTSLWLLRYSYELYRLDGDLGAAFNALPSFHVRQMWFQGAISGLLYSMGNFMSIISVTFLGQGVGYTFTQFSMLVSGLWGIFKFGEIKGRERITNWLFSAVTALLGILWLCYEHSS